MKQITTYVGVDAHKKDLFIAMLVGDRTVPVTWQVPNEPQAVRPLVRKLERGPVIATADKRSNDSAPPPAPGRTPQTCVEDRRGDCAGAGRLPVGRTPTGGGQMTGRKDSDSSPSSA
jgi:hypothetical protein